jgi:hypothetical protein
MISGISRSWLQVVLLEFIPMSSFEIHTNKNYKPELIGEARWLASQPVEDFKPDVMK